MPLPRHLPVRFWIETFVAALGCCLLLVTLIVPTWFERLTGFEPDGRNGSFELVLPLALVAVSATSALAARRHHRQYHRRASPQA